MSETMTISRRELLRQTACGFGYLALAGLCAEEAAANPLRPRPPHRTATAKRVIFLFMHGGPSHVDTFDYKPRLIERDGKTYPYETPPNLSKGTQPILMKSPWKFRQYGESGLWISDLFPHVGRHADDLCLLRGMHTNGQSHGQAVMKLHTGSESLVRPSLGSWVVYGLGSENNNLPGFVTICPPTAHGGVRNYGSAFLPAFYQGTALGSAGIPASKATIRYLDSQQRSPERQKRLLGYLQELNRGHLERAQNDAGIEGVIESYELAFRMQSAAPQVLDLSRETKETLELYGIHEKATENFGRQCLLARRFAEAGVRFIEVAYSNAGGAPWDQHGNLRKGHEQHARAVDKPIAGLLADLKARGLLDDTLVIWGGEFGRTPITQGKNGRDHNPQGYTMWLAGGGVKGGFSYGATDEFGYYAEDGKVHIHDLHATILYLLGLDHERLTYRYAGRDFRLTDIYGRIVHDIIA
ncbi:MAG: sulfatase [Gemmatales bacterium]|nr:MAG: sulfatase [Gemmatales bacterium]